MTDEKQKAIPMLKFFWEACRDKNDEIKTYYVKLNIYILPDHAGKKCISEVRIRIPLTELL